MFLGRRRHRLKPRRCVSPRSPSSSERLAFIWAPLRLSSPCAPPHHRLSPSRELSRGDTSSRPSCVTLHSSSRTVQLPKSSLPRPLPGRPFFFSLKSRSSPSNPQPLCAALKRSASSLPFLPCQLHWLPRCRAGANDSASQLSIFASCAQDPSCEGPAPAHVYSRFSPRQT